MQGVGVTTEDFDGDGALELVTEFLHPQGPISFRVATGNMTMVNVTAHALAFDATKLIAGADSAGPIPLPAGARASIALTLAEKTGGVVGPMTRTTDILTASADVTVKTTMPAQFSSVAVCDVDGDGKPDLVIGAPQAEHLNLTASARSTSCSGAAGWQARSIRRTPTTVMGFTSTALDPGDQLGAAVACADLNGDRVDDLIVGAPGAALGTGRVYAVFGDQVTRPDDHARDRPARTRPTSPGRTAADTGFGGMLFAADLNGDDSAEILVAARRSRRRSTCSRTSPERSPRRSTSTAPTTSRSRTSARPRWRRAISGRPGGVDVDHRRLRREDARRRRWRGGAIYGFRRYAERHYGVDATAYDAPAARPDHLRRRGHAVRRRDAGAATPPARART